MLLGDYDVVVFGEVEELVGVDLGFVVGLAVLLGGAVVDLLLSWGVELLKMVRKVKNDDFDRRG